MGIRSDVFVAIHKDLWNRVEHLAIWERADVWETSIDGHCGFLFRDTKWYRYDDEDLQKLYNAIEGIPELHWIVGACHEYPENSDDDSGEWSDNPWGGTRRFTVEIECGFSDVVGSGLESDSALDND